MTQSFAPWPLRPLLPLFVASSPYRVLDSSTFLRAEASQIEEAADMSATTERRQAESAPYSEEERQLVERIVASAHFRRTARLREFLLYVVGQYIQDPQAELNEQEIGEKVFGRPASYDRSHDNIVRVNATELRRRIELYFAEEGAGETLLLEIPRGGYRPVFRRRGVEASAPPSNSVTQVPVTHAPSIDERPTLFVNKALPTPWRFLWPAATVVLAIACLLLWWRENKPESGVRVAANNTPALTAFWTAFAGNHQPTDIVLSDDSASVIEDITHQSTTLGDYVNRAYMQKVQSSSLSTDRKMDLEQISEHNLVTFGVVRASQMVISHLPSQPAPHLTMARYYSPDAMKRDNVILLGGSKANPWVYIFDDRLSFIVGFDHVAGHAVVSNLHPKPGEQSTYVSPPQPDELTGYGVVAFLPNPSRNGNVIILAGMDSDSTSAAAEFLTSEEQMAKFLTLLKTPTFPHFEVLLRISRLSGASFNAEIVAYRAYPNS